MTHELRADVEVIIAGRMILEMKVERLDPICAIFINHLHAVHFQRNEHEQFAFEVTCATANEASADALCLYRDVCVYDDGLYDASSAF